MDHEEHLNIMVQKKDKPFCATIKDGLLEPFRVTIKMDHV